MNTTETFIPGQRDAIAGTTPMADVFQRMFPRGVLVGEHRAGNVEDYRVTRTQYAEVLLGHAKSVPVEGRMLALGSTIARGLRSRWFLMECGAVYLAIRMTPTPSHSGYQDTARCMAACVSEDEKSLWRRDFHRMVALMNDGPVVRESSYPGRGH